MNIRDLQYLLAVTDLHSFSQAAEQCHISQPTLSSQIKKLEDYLGVALFERNNKTVTITETGEQIAAVARRVLHDVSVIKEIAEHAKDPFSGKFRLGAFPTLSTYAFPSIVGKIRANFPKLKLILIEEKTAPLITRLKSGEIDAALLALPVNEDSLISVKLFDDAFRLAVPIQHPLADKTTIAQTDLIQHKLLLLEEGHCLRDQALEICHQQHIEEEQDFRATGLETLRLMVSAGTGITLMPEIAINTADKNIRYIPFKPPAPKRSIGLVWRKTSTRTILIEQLLPLLRDKYELAAGT